MSSSESAEAELMRKLSAHEKKKLMRHIESSHKGSPKKPTPSQPSGPVKGFNVTPKPFNGNVAKSAAPQPGKVFSRWNPNNPQAIEEKVAPNAALKSVHAPAAKSTNTDVVIPKLNPDHIKMFNAQEAAVSKPGFFKHPTPSASNNTKPPKFSAGGKVFQPQKPSSAAAVKPNPIVKPNPTSNVPTKPAPKISAAASAFSGKAVQGSVSNVAANLNQPKNKPVNLTQNEPKAMQPSPELQRSSSANINRAVGIGVSSQPPSRVTSAFKPQRQAPFSNDKIVIPQPFSQVTPEPKRTVSASNNKAFAKGVSPQPPFHANPIAVKPVKGPSSVVQKNPLPKQPVSQPSSVSGTKPPLQWQQRAGPLSNDKPKNSSKGSPPTAVVAPIQDKSKSPSPNSRNSSEAARQRSVSTPAAPQQHKQHNMVTYTSAADSVMLPDLSLAEKNSVMANEAKMKRSLSEAAKVAAQVKEAAQKNKKLGHNFEPYELKEWITWCDACGSIILSLFGKCVSCTKCKMVCHGKCALAVSLTCAADEKIRSLTLTDNALNYYKTIVQETKDESTLKEYNTIQRVITLEEVQQRIEDFNRTVKGSQQMTLQEDGETFRGFIRVSMNLTRPVSVVDNTSKTVRKPSGHQRKASFYIDKGAMKALHLTSDTTAEEVVQALLLKYNITDNPMKFALFEKQVREEGHVILRKMLPRERPLFLRLLWGNGNHEKRGFILQENESRDIHWESFSIAELYMFIKILDKEENDYILDIKRKYKNKAKDIKNAIDHQMKKASS